MTLQIFKLLQANTEHSPLTLSLGHRGELGMIPPPQVQALVLPLTCTVILHNYAFIVC